MVHYPCEEGSKIPQQGEIHNKNCSLSLQRYKLFYKKVMLKLENIPIEKINKSKREGAIQCTTVNKLNTVQENTVYTQQSVHSNTTNYCVLCRECTLQCEHPSVQSIQIQKYHKKQSVHLACLHTLFSCILYSTNSVPLTIKSVLYTQE